jgi:hypothetical protein
MILILLRINPSKYKENIIIARKKKNMENNEFSAYHLYM